MCLKGPWRAEREAMTDLQPETFCNSKRTAIKIGALSTAHTNRSQIGTQKTTTPVFIKCHAKGACMFASCRNVCWSARFPRSPADLDVALSSRCDSRLSAEMYLSALGSAARPKRTSVVVRKHAAQVLFHSVSDGLRTPECKPLNNSSLPVPTFEASEAVKLYLEHFPLKCGHT